MCGCLLHTPYWRPGPQPRHVPWLEIEPGPFGSQASAQSMEPHQPGLFDSFYDILEKEKLDNKNYKWFTGVPEE